MPLLCRSNSCSKLSMATSSLIHVNRSKHSMMSGSNKNQKKIPKGSLLNRKKKKPSQSPSSSRRSSKGMPPQQRQTQEQEPQALVQTSDKNSSLLDSLDSSEDEDESERDTTQATVEPSESCSPYNDSNESTTSNNNNNNTILLAADEHREDGNASFSSLLTTSSSTTTTASTSPLSKKSLLKKQLSGRGLYVISPAAAKAAQSPLRWKASKTGPSIPEVPVMISPPLLKEEEEEEEDADETETLNTAMLKVRMAGKKKVYNLNLAATDRLKNVIDQLPIQLDGDDAPEVQITCVAKKLIVKSTDKATMEETSLEELGLTPSAVLVVDVKEDAGAATAKEETKGKLAERAISKKRKKGSHTMQSIGIYAKDDNNKAELIDGGGGVWYEHDVSDDEEEGEKEEEEDSTESSSPDEEPEDQADDVDEEES
mmetsp:Transcript_15826/g.36326  ORF Transcript_15826/g.36326 Transcript_15826/m.36326 type:complete len:428 (-) Transcript_15826:82-1365(-)